MKSKPLQARAHPFTDQALRIPSLIDQLRYPLFGITFRPNVGWLSFHRNGLAFARGSLWKPVPPTSQPWLLRLGCRDLRCHTESARCSLPSTGGIRVAASEQSSVKSSLKESLWDHPYQTFPLIDLT